MRRVKLQAIPTAPPRQLMVVSGAPCYLTHTTSLFSSQPSPLLLALMSRMPRPRGFSSLSRASSSTSLLRKRKRRSGCLRREPRIVKSGDSEEKGNK